ncbi:MAG: glycosyltransferase family 4 protein [Chitinophagaceae bacterium]
MKNSIPNLPPLISMKVLFIARATLYKNAGGDTIQINNTAAFLRKKGIEVDIALSNSTPEYSPYDLLHFFNVIRPADMLLHIERAQKPYVISTIFVDYTETEQHASGPFRKALSHILSADTMEYLKVLARYIINGERVISRYYLQHGHRKSIEKVIKGAMLLLPNSHNEYKRLKTHYTFNKQYCVIPNGVDATLFNIPEANHLLKDDNLVICVARIEPLKNQLNLIKALNNTPFKLYLIGSAALNQQAYYEKCRNAAAENISFLGQIPQAALKEYYQKAKVHILPSWFETTGLSSLEAAAMGCNIVVTAKGDTTEYFQHHAYYCEPDSVESIFNTIQKAATTPAEKDTRTYILNNFTWEIAAEKTFIAYKEALNSIK